MPLGEELENLWNCPLLKKTTLCIGFAPFIEI